VLTITPTHPTTNTMKSSLRLPILLASAFACSSSLVCATDDFAAGDLALVFYSLTGTAPGVFGTEYYVLNLGPASSFRENTANNVAVKTVNGSINSSNINSDLVNVFGAGWAEDGTVRMAAVTTIPQEGVLTNGDPTRTVYFSATRSALNSGQTGYDANTPFIYYQGNTGANTLSSGTRTQSSNAIKGFIYGTSSSGVNGAINLGVPTPTSGLNLSGVRLTTSYVGQLNNYVPPTTGGTYFQLGIDPTATLGPGTLPGTAGVEAAVDIFRVLHSATGADLTSGSSTGNAVLGQGQFIGSITIDSAGNLKVQAVGGSTGSYTTWATTNGVTGGPNGDSDFDGISNLVEYGLNLNAAASDGAPGTYSGGTLTFSKRAEAVTNNDVTYAIQESDDLGIVDAWQTVTPTTDTTTEISYLIPTGSQKKFSRLVVTQVP
jgi:hypothetical protein